VSISVSALLARIADLEAENASLRSGLDSLGKTHDAAVCEGAAIGLMQRGEEVVRLRAENKRLVEERDGLRLVYEAARTIPTTAASEMYSKGMPYSSNRVADTIEACVYFAANDARAGEREDRK
jgi:hypothetical protein